jgi:hypothetical protein
MFISGGQQGDIPHLKLSDILVALRRFAPKLNAPGKEYSILVKFIEEQLNIT